MKNEGALRCVFEAYGIYRSDVSSNHLPLGLARFPVEPVSGYRTRRKEHALPIVRDEFRPAIPRRVARQHCPSPLHRHHQLKTIAASKEIIYHRTVPCLLTVCLSPGDNPNIDSGKNVEQAYSYAIHRDIRVPLYALCNGRKLVVFDVSRGPALINVQLREIESIWLKVVSVLGCRSAWPLGIRPGFRPDFGLAVFKAGLAFDKGGQKMNHIMMSVSLVSVAKLEDCLYSVTGVCLAEEPPGFMVTFDFGPVEYLNFLAVISADYADLIRTALSRQPYIFKFEPFEGAPDLAIAGFIGDTMYTNDDESYIPFSARKFIR
jgi:hypothetical protein